MCVTPPTREQEHHVAATFPENGTPIVNLKRRVTLASGALYRSEVQSKGIGIIGTLTGHTAVDPVEFVEPKTFSSSEQGGAHLLFEGVSQIVSPTPYPEYYSFVWFNLIEPLAEASPLFNVGFVNQRHSNLALQSLWLDADRNFFPKWFEHFLHYSKPSATDPVLLILDGHATHTKNVQLIEAARQNHVHILCIPPHTSHRLQPLDVSFMFPLSTFHTQECETWMRQNPGRAITIRQVGSIFGKSYLKASTPQNAINGFKKTGIFPLDPNVFPEEAFAASETTDRDLDADAVTIQDAVFHATENPVVDKTSSSTTNVMQDINVSPITVDSNCASCSNVSSSSPTQTIPPDSNVASCSGLQTPIFKKISKNNYVSPIDIMPAPKVKSTCETRKVSKNRGKTAVLTSSPYLKELQEKKGQKVSKRKVVETKLPKQKKPRKGTKGQNKKNTEPISSDEEVEDTSCIVCDGTFLKSKEGEGWISCSICRLWAHEECSGFDTDNDKPYVCDFCT
ncbi:hypothetical protein PPYR_15450 [Photinus pyralis]|uniref:Zinc finger PHD-type domain-containing protein n=1 Tax=Photinus pyralis TaxID=7054 RepID=A0A5N3ZYT2_PHOPY|nr:hypothetical protein PPYR_15450 [Photinus pyralis]